MLGASKMKKIGYMGVCIINHGEKYGIDNCVTNSDEPLIEFYDISTKPSHFVARYQLSHIVQNKLTILKKGLVINNLILTSGMAIDLYKYIERSSYEKISINT